MFRSIVGGLFILISLAFSSLAQAGSWSAETEGGGSEKSASFASQYLFYNGEHGNALARYYYVEDELERGEFAAGPTWHLGPTEVQIQVGVTTLDQAMTAILVVAPIAGHTVVYVGDAKTSWIGEAHTFYQKMWIALSEDETWQVRLEDFLVDGVNEYALLGVEYRFHLLEGKVELFVAPFYDLDNKELGGQGGLRLLNW